MPILFCVTLLPLLICWLVGCSGHVKGSLLLELSASQPAAEPPPPAVPVTPAPAAPQAPVREVGDGNVSHFFHQNNGNHGHVPNFGHGKSSLFCFFFFFFPFFECLGVTWAGFTFAFSQSYGLHVGTALRTGTWQLPSDFLKEYENRRFKFHKLYCPSFFERADFFLVDISNTFFKWPKTTNQDFLLSPRFHVQLIRTPQRAALSLSCQDILAKHRTSLDHYSKACLRATFSNQLIFL